MSAYDGAKRPDPDKDPTKDIQWEIQRLAKGIGADLVKVVMELIDASTDAIQEWVGTLVNPLLTSLTGMTLEEAIDLLKTNPLMFLPTVIANFIQNGVLGVASPLNALNIFGLLKSFNIPLLPLSAIGNADSPNLLVAPGFDAMENIQFGQSGWAWDGTTGRTTNGSLKCIPAGLPREIVSVAIPVSEGQKIDLGVWMKWTGLTYTGTNPFTIAVLPYVGSVKQLPQTLQSPNTPAMNQSTWTEYKATYTAGPGVTEVRLQFRVNATGGSLWFDDAEGRKTATSLPQSWITNLIPDLEGIVDFFRQVADAIVRVLTGAPFFGVILGPAAQAIFDGLFDFFEDHQATTAVASDAKLGVKATQTALFQSATQTSDPLPTDQVEADNVVQAALDAQTQAIISTAAQLQAVASATVGQAYSGTIALEEFDQDIAGVSAVWDSQFIVGSAAIAKIIQEDGFAGMEWTSGQSDTMVDQFLHYIGPGRVTTTNYQRITLLVGRAHQQPGFFDGRRARWHVYGRVSADGLTWVRGYYTNYGEAGVEYRINGGAIQTLATETGDTKNAPPASTITLECGYQGSDRTFRVLVNGSSKCAVNDSSNLTSIGAAFREHGWGERTNGHLPGTANQYTANDNKSANVIGSGCRIYRASTGNVFQPSNSIARLANNTWDTISHRTPDITVDLTTGGITINTTGWYLFYWRYNYNAHNFTDANQRYAGILLKGTAGLAAGAFRGSDGRLVMEPLDTVPVYVTAGETYYFGIVTSNIFSPQISGDADGLYTYAGCALMNNRVAA